MRNLSRDGSPSWWRRQSEKERKEEFHTILECRVPSGSFGHNDGFKNVITVENWEESHYFY